MAGRVWWFWEWVSEEEVKRQCKSRMDIFDTLPAVVRSAIREADGYTEIAEAKRLVKRHGAAGAAKIILNHGIGTGGIER
jgi:hypothetical protein